MKSRDTFTALGRDTPRRRLSVLVQSVLQRVFFPSVYRCGVPFRRMQADSILSRLQITKKTDYVKSALRTHYSGSESNSTSMLDRQLPLSSLLDALRGRRCREVKPRRHNPTIQDLRPSRSITTVDTPLIFRPRLWMQVILISLSAYSLQTQ